MINAVREAFAEAKWAFTHKKANNYDEGTLEHAAWTVGFVRAEIDAAIAMTGDQKLRLEVAYRNLGEAVTQRANQQYG